MKWSLLFPIFIILLLGKNVNGQQHYFNSIYDENPAGSSTWSALEYNSKYITCGVSVHPNFFNQRIVIIEIDSNGNMNTSRIFGDIYKHYYTGLSGSLKPFNDGFMFAGSVEDYTGFHAKLWRFDNSLDTVFTKNYSNERNWMVFGNCCLTIDSGIIFCGQLATVNDSIHIFLLKTDSSGNEQWRRSYRLGEFNYAHNIIQTIDEGFLVGGYINKPGNSYSGDPIIFKTDSIGNFLWVKNLGTDIKDGLAVVNEYPNGNIIVGYTYGVYQGPPYPVPPPYMKIGISKLDQGGNEIWSMLYGYPQRLNYIRKIIFLSDNSILAAGESYADTIYHTLKGWLLKVNNFGDSVWYRDYAYYNNQYSDNYLHDVYETSDNGFLLGGEAVRTQIPGDQLKIWIAKTDSAGCLEPDCDPTIRIEDIAQCSHKDFIIYPNPANNIITFRLPISNGISHLPQKSKMQIISVNGIILDEIVIESGKREYTLQLSSEYLPGVYLSILMIGEEVYARKKFVIF